MSGPSQVIVPLKRPHSLAEVARRGAHGHIDAHLREFLDEYYLCPTAQSRCRMLQEEPARLNDERANAYLGAVAEHLARLQHTSPPRWVHQQFRFMRRAYFPIGLESLKARMIMESPSAFRRRMIFVGADALCRPRKFSRGIGVE